MADNKILQTLSIDGVAMDNFQDFRETKNKSGFALAVDTIVDTDPITIDKPGTYLFQIWATFAQATSTGAVRRSIGYTFPGDANMKAVQTNLDATNAGAYKRHFAVAMVAPGNTIAVKGAISSSKASNTGCTVSISVWKILEPVGG